MVELFLSIVMIRLIQGSHMAAGHDIYLIFTYQMNNFIGIRANKWECPENWVADDNSSVEHAPCGNDVPVFPSVSIPFKFICHCIILPIIGFDFFICYIRD